MRKFHSRDLSLEITGKAFLSQQLTIAWMIAPDLDMKMVMSWTWQKKRTIMEKNTVLRAPHARSMRKYVLVATYRKWPQNDCFETWTFKIIYLSRKINLPMQGMPGMSRAKRGFLWVFLKNIQGGSTKFAQVFQGFYLVLYVHQRSV